MSRMQSAMPLAVAVTLLGCARSAAQERPNFSGIWRLDAAESLLIGEAPLGERRITWIIDHRDPEIHVVVDVRDPEESHEFSFRCTTNGEVCVNELPELDEVRRISAVWEGDVLVMTQRAESPRGGFRASDRVYLADAGQRLVFERVVSDERSGRPRERPVRQVFRKLGPHPSQRTDAHAPLPSVVLPPELERVLRDYERHWQAGDAPALAALFTEDGFVSSRAGWIRGRDAIRDARRGTSSALRLRAVAYALDERVGYIVGAYGYGAESSVPDRGTFVLALRKSQDGRWLIAADLDGIIRP